MPASGPLTLHGAPIASIPSGIWVPGVTRAPAAIIARAPILAPSSTVLDGARIGARAMIAAGALVTPGTEIPDGMLAMGAPCKVRGPLAGTPAARWVELNPTAYQALAQRHRAGVHPA